MKLIHYSVLALFLVTTGCGGGGTKKPPTPTPDQPSDSQSLLKDSRLTATDMQLERPPTKLETSLYPPK